jgi:hypothetical protein
LEDKKMGTMGSSRLWGKIILLVAVCGWGLSAQAKYGAGSGTQAEPFRIGDVSDWQELMTTPADWASHFVLTADIDLNDVPITPIGNDPNNFTGVFDGNDYAIRNADVNMPGSNYVGLFGYLGKDGQIKNLGAEDVSILGQNCVGALVGYKYSGTISNCYSTGWVSGRYLVGGLVGENYGTITNCYSTGSVIGTGERVGGLVGMNHGTITNSYSTGPASGTVYYVGGLVGDNFFGTISNCYSTGPVSATGELVGGLAGWSYGGNFTACFWDIETSGQARSSGGTGKTTTEMKTIQTYLDAGWDFTIEDGDPADWVMPGNDYPHLAWQYWTWGIIPDVNDLSREEAEIAITSAGFLMGSINYTISETVPPGYVVNQYPSSGSTGILGVTKIDLVVSCGSQISAGSGTPDDPYQIETVSDWMLLTCRSDFWNKRLILTADIDLQGVAALSPVGNRSQPFTGVFDGNRRIIRNVVITMPNSDNVGLFGYVGQNGQIRNVGLENIAITGQMRVGGLVGWNYCGSITACYTTGSVSGVMYAGGLVGHNGYHSDRCSYYFDPFCEECGACRKCWADIQPSLIYKCYSKASVVASSSTLGGLVGWNEGSIISCYSNGSVSGWQEAGGLVALNWYGLINNCYSTGSVTILPWLTTAGGLVQSRDNFSRSTDCFWNVETSTRTTSFGGKGLATIQMKSLATYRNAGWAGRGWVINDGYDYPRLDWENSGGAPIPDPEPAPLSGSGTLEDPYQIWTADDFVILSQYASILDKHIVLMAEIDLQGVALSPIGSNQPFKGVFDGNGHIIRNVVITMPDSEYVGLFGEVDPNGQIKNIGVENAAITGQSCVGGLVGRNHNGSITGCYVTGLVCGRNLVGGLVGASYYGNLTDCYATSDVNGNGSYVGGLMGWNYYGSLSACCAGGDVSGSGEHIGGLMGVNYYGSLTACYAAGDVNGNSVYVGGLVGWNEGRLTACYAMGSVNGGDYVGGLIGVRYYSMLTDCYAAGSVSGEGEYVGGLVGVCTSGGLAASFWDVNTSGRTWSAAGTPKTTVQMETQSTFTSARWDFIGETANGTADIWAICEGTNYPRFVYQIPQGDIVCPDGVNSVDYSILARYWHETGCAALDDCEGADTDLSGAVDFGDVAAVAESWLRDVR